MREQLERFGHFKKYKVKIEGEWNLAITGDNITANVTMEKHEHYYAAPSQAEDEGRTREAARTRYLGALRRFCSFLPLAAISADESSDEDVTLDDVYVELNTTAEAPLSEAEKAELKKGRSRLPDDARRPVTAV